MSYNLLKLLTVPKVILRMLLRVSINLKEEGGGGEKKKKVGGKTPNTWPTLCLLELPSHLRSKVCLEHWILLRVAEAVGRQVRAATLSSILKYIFNLVSIYLSCENIQILITICGNWLFSLDGMQSFDLQLCQTLERVRLLYLSFIHSLVMFPCRKILLYVNLSIQMQDLDLMKINLRVPKT